MARVHVVRADAGVRAGALAGDEAEAGDAVRVVHGRSDDGRGIARFCVGTDGNRLFPLAGGGQIPRYPLLPRSEVRELVPVVRFDLLYPHEREVWQVRVVHVVRGFRRNRAEVTEVVADAEVVRHHGRRLLGRDLCRVGVAADAGHRHLGPRPVVARTVPHVDPVEVERRRENDVHVAFDFKVLRSRSKFHRGMVELGVAEERDAVECEALDDGLAVRRAVRQVRIVVVGLEDVEEHVAERLALIAVCRRRLQPAVRVEEQRHGGLPVAAHQQVRVVPGAADDLAVGMHFTHEIFRIHLRIDVVAADAVLVVRVEALADDVDVAERHRPKVGIPLVHGSVQEEAALRLVKAPVDAVPVLVPHHVRDEGRRVAAAAGRVEVHARPVPECVARPVHVDVRRQRLIELHEIRHPGLHVVVHPVHVVERRTLLHVAEVVENEVVRAFLPINDGRRHLACCEHARPAAFQRHRRRPRAGRAAEVAIGIGMHLRCTKPQAEVRHRRSFLNFKRIVRVDIGPDGPVDREDGGIEAHAADDARRAFCVGRDGDFAVDVDDPVHPHVHLAGVHVHPRQVAARRGGDAAVDGQLADEAVGRGAVGGRER